MSDVTTTTPSSRRDILTAAEAHIIGLSASSDPALTTWAAGVLIIHHAQQLAVYLSSGDPSRAFGSQYTGGYTREYDYQCELRTVTITAHARGYRTTVRLRDIAVLLDPVLQRHDRCAAIGQAMRERRLLTDVQQLAVDRRQRAKTPAEAERTPAEREADEAWREIERRCEQLATESWVACRPDLQQALFDL